MCSVLHGQRDAVFFGHHHARMQYNLLQYLYRNIVAQITVILLEIKQGVVKQLADNLSR